MKALTLRLDDQENDALRLRAYLDDRPKSDIIRAALRAYLRAELETVVARETRLAEERAIGSEPTA